MMTLGQLKRYFAAATVNQALQGSDSIMGDIVHWVATDIIGTADFWWNQGNDSFNTVANQAQYFLSNRVFMNKIWGLFDQNNDWPLIQKDLSWFYQTDPTPTETGDAKFWAYVGQNSCQAVQSVAGVLNIVSSNNGDTAINAVAKGISGGIERYDILELTGTSSKAGLVSWDANKPVSFNVESACSGVVTASIGATTVAEIPPKHLRVLRPQVRLKDIPGSVVEIDYFFYKRASEPVSDADDIDLPDYAFTALRAGIEEVTLFLVNKPTQSLQAHQKYLQEMFRLITVSERDVAGNQIKNWRESTPLMYRLPDTITGAVIA